MKVGTGVSEGGMVGVLVGKNIGVTVAGAVGEGSGLSVPVGSIVADGAMNVNPPHPIRKRVNPDIQIIDFLVNAGLSRYRPFGARMVRGAISLEMDMLLYGGKLLRLTGSQCQHAKVDGSNPRECAGLRG